MIFMVQLINYMIFDFDFNAKFVEIFSWDIYDIEILNANNNKQFGQKWIQN